jgi:hypothetical protein
LKRNIARDKTGYYVEIYIDLVYADLGHLGQIFGHETNEFEFPASYLSLVVYSAHKNDKNI